MLGVVSQPDRPKGRKLVLQPTPIKALAERPSLPVTSPPIYVAARLPLAGCKHSPRCHRGHGLWTAAGIQRAGNAAKGAVSMCILLASPQIPRCRADPVGDLEWDAQSGVSLMQMDEEDTGPIIATQSIPIEATTTAALLHDQLGELGAQLMRTHLKDFVVGALQPRSQGCRAGHPRAQDYQGRWLDRLGSKRPADRLSGARWTPGQLPCRLGGAGGAQRTFQDPASARGWSRGAPARQPRLPRPRVLW